jgi:hypothetical protein
MQPYVIKQGDYLAKLACQFGFDADTVWSDPKNADLRKLRSDPNLLWPTDILYIPDQVNKQPVLKSLTTGTTNTFVSDTPTVTVNLKFADAELASQPYTIPELPQLTGLTTRADGTATIAMPITQRVVTVVFTSDGTAFTCNVGHVDPINTLSGVIQRLQNLGFLDPNADLETFDLDSVRGALREFLATQPGAAVDSPSSPSQTGDAPAQDVPTQVGGEPDDYDFPPPASAPDPSEPTESSASSDGSDDAPPSSGNPSMPSGGDPADAPTPTDDGSASSDGSDDAPPSSDNMDPPSSGGAPVDNAGLGDDGLLDDATSQLLSTAHGS